jgi:hypothetical protein
MDGNFTYHFCISVRCRGAAIFCCQYLLSIFHLLPAYWKSIVSLFPDAQTSVADTQSPVSLESAICQMTLAFCQMASILSDG